MTAANSAANGASLEDCHTNLFALTDLSGIRWRKLSAPCPTEQAVGPLEDPVLISYSRCLAANILSVWRRVAQSSPNNIFLDVQPVTETTWEKELWIYWYGDDPNWEDLLSPELKEVDRGTWDNCLSYECRTLLFKSLHNLIERCLLSRNLVRLGKWFIRPYDNFPHHGENFSDHLSFSFSFFLHGESTVCSSVGTMLHQPISRLTSDHLAIAQGSATGFQVVLVPYGMGGVLTGQSFKANHHVAQKTINEWKHFYPVVPEEIKKENGEEGNEDQKDEDKEAQFMTPDYGDDTLPAVVEVLVGGVRLFYPSVYVMVPHSDELMSVPTTPQPMGSSYMHPPSSTHNPGSMKMPGSMNVAAMSTISLTPPTSPPDQLLLGDPKLSMMPPPGMPGSSGGGGGGYQTGPSMDAMYGIPEIVASPKTVANKLAGKIWKDWTLPRDTTGRVSPIAATQTTSVPPGSVSNPGSQSSDQAPPTPNNQSEEGSNTEMKSTATNTSNSATNMWEFVDPATKISNCGCSRQKNSKAKGSGTQFGKPQSVPGHSNYGSSSSSKHKSDSKQERQQRSQRPITPFHHRAMMTEDFIAIEHEMANQRFAAAAAANTAVMGPSSQQDVKLGGSGGTNAKFTQPSPAFRPVGTADSSLTESPPSVAPSPLVAPSTSTTNPNERTMPTLSPYPPARSGSDSGTPTASNAPTVLPRTELAMNGLDNHEGSSHLDVHKTPGEHGGGSHSIGEGGKEEGSEEDLLWQCFKLPLGPHVDYKRPLLPHQNCEGSETNEAGLDSLYDADNNNEVFSQPLKKLKQERPVPVNNFEMLPGVFTSEIDIKPRMPSPDPIDPYEFDDTSPTQGKSTSSVRMMKGKNVKGNKPKGLMERRNSKKLLERKKQEEEAQRRAATEEDKHKLSEQQGGQQNGVDGALSNMPKSKLDSISSSLTQETDLKLTANDLDNLFESSSDDDMGGGDFDDVSSKLPEPNTDDGTTKPIIFGASLDSSTNLQGTGNTPTELVRMFPTPPSLEQSAFSPQACTDYINHGSTQGMGQTEQNNSGDFADIDVDESMESPKPEPIEDWSYVYKVPIMERIVGPSIYAPLKSLPSSKLPPLRITEACTYKATWQQLPLSPKPDFIPSTKESTVQNLSSVDADLLNSQQVGRTPPAASSNSQSPAMYPGSQEPRSAANQELQSPASEASSYARNLNSLEAPTPSNSIPEAHGLYINLVLSDSLLNTFKDRNFDSCVICACNMDIKGADAALYTPDLGIPCSCGFSEIMNRRYAVGSGLFVEDESEITGQSTDVALWAYHRDNPYCAGEINRKGALSLEDSQSKDNGNEIVQRTSNALLKLIQDQCNTPYSTLCRLNTIAKRNLNSSGHIARSQLEIDDGCAVCFSALEQGRFLMAEGLGAKLSDDPHLRRSCLHSWPYTPGVARGLLSSQDVVRTMSSLQPLLQDAIQKKRTMRLWERPYLVQGPLTWQVFFNMSFVKGTSESPEPLPIPPLLVGFDKDWLSSSPFTLHYWEKLLLEPYSAQRDVAYIALVPDNDHVLQCALPFFKELTAVYETCKLGRHAPIAKTQRDGIFRIGKKYADKVSTEMVDNWFSETGVVADASKLKLYAQVCKAYVAPLLMMHPPDSSLFTISRHDRSASGQGSTPSTQNLSSTIAGSTTMHSNSMHTGSSSSSSHISSQSHSGGGGDHVPGGSSSSSTTSAASAAAGAAAAAAAAAASSMPAPSQTPAGTGKDKDGEIKVIENNSGIPDIVDPKDLEQPPAVVIYIVDPFSYGDDSVEEFPSTATLGLLKCFIELFSQLNGTLQRNIVLQVIPIQQVLQVSNSDMTERLLSQMKTLAFSVFSQCRRHLRPSLFGRSLTSFGPSADLTKMMKEYQREQFTKMYSPPYILASLKDKQTELGESFGELSKQSGELFCSYCLSHDQRWMLVACTDSKGEMLETQVIHIDVPNRKRRKKVSVRHIAFNKLWDFLMAVISKTAIPWRLVIGRFGRIGQGELRDWSILLSRPHLNKQSKILKDMCRMCTVPTTNNDFPCIVSACLVSIEPEPGLRIMADSVAADKCSKNAQRDQPSCQLHTPDDATCTHILVFPTSATKQIASNAQAEQPILDLNFGPGGNDNVDDLMSSFANEVGDLGFDMEGLLGLPVSPTMTDPAASPGAPQSPNGSATQVTATETSKPSAETTTQQQPSNVLDDGEFEPLVLQQPLALGYFVSTAKTGQLPEWFWSSCPEAEHTCPVFLKAALHVHNVQQTSDEILQTKHTHPLDSNLTTDPLRYVLETYNSLSWLTVDPASGDRRSCLPVHMVVLVQLYNTIAALL